MGNIDVRKKRILSVGTSTIINGHLPTPTVVAIYVSGQNEEADVLTHIDGGIEGQEIILFYGGENITITETGNISTCGGGSIILVNSGCWMRLIYRSGPNIWYTVGWAAATP